MWHLKKNHPLNHMTWRQLWQGVCVALALQISVVNGFHQILDASADRSMLCEGMYAKGDIRGDADPYILVEFPPHPETDSDVSLVIYAWEDEALLGVRPKDSPNVPKTYICGDEAIDFKLCNETQRGHFLITEPPNNETFAPIHTELVRVRQNQTEPIQVRYDILRTGWYCVNSIGLSDYSATVYWEGPYGKAPATEYPKLIVSHDLYMCV
jgi:hypothetical protein